MNGKMQKDHPPADLPLERMIFFSDAVFAIAITLLVIEIRVPELAPGATSAEAARALLALMPSLFAFALSFLVIGRFWMGHHKLFSHVTHFADRLLWPNMLFLLAIAFMPFATGFLGRNLGHFVPALVYNLTMLASAVLNLTLMRVADRALLIDSGLDRRALRSRPVSVVLAALVCAGLTFVVPLFSQLGMATIPIWLRLLSRWNSEKP